MTITTRKGVLADESCDALVIGAFAGPKKEIVLTHVFDTAFTEHLLHVLREDRFKAKEGSLMIVRTEGRIPAKRIVVVGLGAKEDLETGMLRRGAAQAFSALKPLGAKSVVLSPIQIAPSDTDPSESIQAMVEGIRLSDYSFGRYKKKPKHTMQSVTIVLDDARLVRKAQAAVALGELTSGATITARDLVNTPSLHLAPKDLVDAAKDIAKGAAEIKVKIFDKERLLKMGAGGILAVNQGSDHDPFLVHMIYRPKKKTKKSIALVGKAVTFDSGGLSLKPADSMMDMKIDMSGAAAVLGVFSQIVKLQPNVIVHGIFGAVENMPSGKAIRPGDIVTAMNGKTIEILNTDAEGRVTLADSLTYACKQKPDLIIDLATLTGACMVALGDEFTGLMSNNPELAERVLAAAAHTGEHMWQLPLYKGYKQLIVSELADVKNIGGRYGGALTAGLFLQEFVEKDMPWVHLDIAGPSHTERPFSPFETKGATGHPVRTLIQFLRSF